MKEELGEMVKKSKVAWLFLLISTFVIITILTFVFFIFKDTRYQQEQLKIELLLDIQRDLKDIKRYYE